MTKSLIALMTTLLIANSAFASGGYKFICKQTDSSPGGDRITMVMTQIGNKMQQEGEEGKFLIELFYTSMGTPFFKRIVKTEIEDVQLFYASADKEIQGTMYLDESEQTVHFKNQQISMDCE